MRTFLLFASILLGVLAVTEKEYQSAFINWMKEHKRTYDHAEFNTRYAIFKNNYDYVEENNAEDNGMILSLNQFADLESAEFASLYLGYRASAHSNITSSGPIISARSELPESWNWVSQGAVTGVKNQEQCGACWSFSTTGSTEGCHQISTGSLVSLSEQNLIDCSSSYGNKGCNGGAMVDAMEYIINNGGIDTESSYPYQAEEGKCRYNAANSAATLSSYVNVASGSESDLKAKAAVGPVSVAIDASLKSFQLYKSGIYYEAKCSSTALDHGVLVVGWGKNSNGEYWIVKNSWGTSWGIEGYVWMARNRGNNCGIATAATLPTC